MTSNPCFLPIAENDNPLARRTLFVAYEGMGLLDLTGPLTVFWSASRFLELQGRHGYARHTVSLDGGPVLTAEGVTIDTAPISQFDIAEIDTIVVPGALDMPPSLADRRLVDWLAANAPRARRTASLCAGAFLLAEAGLLDGRRAVTHWASCELLDQRYTTLTVEPDAIFVQDGPIWTSAGVSAGIDLSLALIQDLEQPQRSAIERRPAGRAGRHEPTQLRPQLQGQDRAHAGQGGGGVPPGSRPAALGGHRAGRRTHRPKLRVRRRGAHARHLPASPGDLAARLSSSRFEGRVIAWGRLCGAAFRGCFREPPRKPSHPAAARVRASVAMTNSSWQPPGLGLPAAAPGSPRG